MPDLFVALAIANLFGGTARSQDLTTSATQPEALRADREAQGLDVGCGDLA